jgi:hypothetical protein
VALSIVGAFVELLPIDDDISEEQRVGSLRSRAK